jgi:hypothetical protein
MRRQIIAGGSISPEITEKENAGSECDEPKHALSCAQIGELVDWMVPR